MKDLIKPARTFALSAASFIFSAIAAVLVITALAACAGRSVSSAPKPNTPDPSVLAWNKDAKKTMRAFGSEDELKNYFRQLAEERKRALERARREASVNPPAPSGLAGVANQTAAPAKAAEGYAAKDEESITNTQHAGVDEGGIVKLHGDHLVVLRRGRLFTVAIGDGSLKPISTVDAFGPEIDPRYTWYDEMLVSEDTVAVIGYSYERGGTEVGLFRIDRAGNLAYRSTYHLRSNGSSPNAIGVSGSPVDQFSFLESEDKHLNVLVRSNGSGDGMWAAERAAGDVALLRIPLNSFNDGSNDASSWDYHGLPKPSGYTFQNRFVGDYLLYGTGSGWGAPENKNKSNLFVVHWADGDLNELTVAHGVDRIEALGSDAIVVGTDGNDLHFTAIRLGQSPEVADEYIRKGASQGELRSHGFFYKPDGPNSGVLGLPISVPGRSGYRHLFEGSAAILFLRNNSLHFEEVGELAAQSEKAVDDACRASCVDWYGNSRPIFARGRILALLGYEIVEANLKDGRIREARRINYAPQAISITRR